MEGLHIAVKSAREKSLLHGINLPSNGPHISHMFYVDDAIFVGMWDRTSIKNLSAILKCFHISSGLHVNFHKSLFFGLGILDQESNDLAKVLGCAEGAFPFNYLGVPVGENKGLKKHWKAIIDKFRSKISDWKAKAFLFGGRLTLIRYILNNFPTYFMSLFKAPQGII